MSSRPGDRFVADALVVVSYSDRSKVQQWYNRVENEVSPTEELALMKDESMKIDEYRRAYDKAHEIKNSVDGLTRGECMAVTMYSLNDPMFYAKFNSDCRNGSWQYYQVYSALLFSACRKLAQKYPVQQVLYRGLRAEASSPSSNQFFWPQFTSTSLDKGTAMKFSNGSTKTLLEFSSCRSGAKIEKLSVFGAEHEVLVLPFESFDYLETKKTTISEMIFRSSASQSFI